MRTAQPAEAESVREAVNAALPPRPKLLVSIPEAVHITGIGRSKLYELLAAGEIVSVRVGKRRLIPTASLEEFVARLVASAP